jgi:hypothetical protein
MFSRFIDRLKDKHEIKICGFYKNSSCLSSIDYCLDVFNKRTSKEIYNQFGAKNLGSDKQIIDIIANDILDWQPDLAINDLEPITATLANLLSIPIWYCSSLLQVKGCYLEYEKAIPKPYRVEVYKKLELLPKAERYLIYSPLSLFENRPPLKEGYEWVQPYFEFSTIPNTITSLLKKILPENSMVTGGETTHIADCIAQNIIPYFRSDPSNIEQMINSNLYSYSGIGINLGQSENIDYLKGQAEKKSKIPKQIFKEKTIEEILNG